MTVRMPLLACLIVLCSGLGPARAEETASEETVTIDQIERITAAVPWPRGVRYVGGKLYVLGRGVHRSAGGPQADIDDKAGYLFEIDPKVSEPARPDTPVGDAVRNNAKVLAGPTEPPFHIWNREMPPTRDTLCMRPYCMLVYDAPSRNLIICGYSGHDQPKPVKFRKNATDSILRYDLRSGKWYAVDVHDPDVVPASDLKKSVDPKYYPHHDMATNPPPHGLINGPCGAAVAGEYLYVGAKDNTALVQYDLSSVRKNPDAPPPPGRFIFHRASKKDDAAVFVRVKGHGMMYVEGNSAVEAHDGWLYVAFRTTSQILRFPLNDDGSLKEPLVGEYIAQFNRYTPGKGGSANIYDMTFDKEGRLYVSTGYDGAIYGFKPDPKNVYHSKKGYTPYVDLEKLVGAKKTVNICFDDDDNLYITSGQKVLPDTKIRGVVYRVRRS